MSARYILIARFTALTGYSDKAVRRKIEEGVWIEGRIFRRAPDGHILMDMQGYEAWVEGQLEPSNRSKGRSGSSSRSTANAA